MQGRETKAREEMKKRAVRRLQLTTLKQKQPDKVKQARDEGMQVKKKERPGRKVRFRAGEPGDEGEGRQQVPRPSHTEAPQEAAQASKVEAAA